MTPRPKARPCPCSTRARFPTENRSTRTKIVNIRSSSKLGVGEEEGEAMMSKGQIDKFTLSHEYAYGERGHLPLIPPKATLIFEVELLSFK
ncbi:hypothetical protein KXD40_000823 [Peronospora effusa]|uniref:peptidylprolyl isomerase n=1 Tax=Peronospora effusa TaxID=542832 RepID=A0A3M6VR34_9STRA|nr:hypothetical protein DD238_006523 [Peronospora effusa]RQM10000.1 hypothetical protein DD237_006870 [Peronospora effusa]UIZ21678.1 hypothetical protein KXD40_000823 [Peronospora effusa]